MTEPDLVAATRCWMDGVLAQCAARERRGGGRTRAWRMGPLALEQVWFDQARFEFFHRPFAHLPPAAGAIDLRLHCVDARDGIALGLSPFRKRDLGPCRSIPALEASPLRVLWDQDHRFVQAVDLATGRGFFFVEDFDLLPEWEPPVPFRSFIHWWAAAHGHLFIHAGSAGLDTGGVVLLGPAGAGKSTTTLACLDAGLKTCGDDYVLLTLGAAPRVHSVYGTAKIKNDSALLPRPLVARLAAGSVGVAQKTILFPATEIEGSFAASFPLKALAVLAIGGGAATAIHRVSAMDALKAAGPSTVLQMSFAQAAGLKAIAALARALPCVRISLGRDLAEVGAAIADFVRGVTADANPASLPPRRRAVLA